MSATQGYDFEGEARRILERRRRRDEARGLVRSGRRAPKRATFAKMRELLDERELDGGDEPYARVRQTVRR